MNRKIAPVVSSISVNYYSFLSKVHCERPLIFRGDWLYRKVWTIESLPRKFWELTLMRRCTVRFQLTSPSRSILEQWVAHSQNSS